MHNCLVMFFYVNRAYQTYIFRRVYKKQFARYACGTAATIIDQLQNTSSSPVTTSGSMGFTINSEDLFNQLPEKYLKAPLVIE